MPKWVCDYDRNGISNFFYLTGSARHHQSRHSDRNSRYHKLHLRWSCWADEPSKSRFCDCSTNFDNYFKAPKLADTIHTFFNRKFSQNVFWIALLFFAAWFFGSDGGVCACVCVAKSHFSSTTTNIKIDADEMVVRSQQFIAQTSAPTSDLKLITTLTSIKPICQTRYSRI